MPIERSTYRHGQVKTDALEAGRRRLEQGGAASVSLRKIAGDIGVAHSALYRHFADQEDLMASVAASGFAELAEAVAAIETQAAFRDAYLAYALAHPALYQLMMAQPHGQTQRHPALSEAVRALIDAAVRVFGDPALDDEENRRRVFRVWMLLHGGLSLHFGGILDARSDAAFAAEMAQIVRRNPA